MSARVHFFTFLLPVLHGQPQPCLRVQKSSDRRSGAPSDLTSAAALSQANSGCLGSSAQPLWAATVGQRLYGNEHLTALATASQPELTRYGAAGQSTLMQQPGASVLLREQGGTSAASADTPAHGLVVPRPVGHVGTPPILLHRCSERVS